VQGDAGRPEDGRVNTEIERDLELVDRHMPPDASSVVPGFDVSPWPDRIKILFIAVNDGTGQLALDEEHRAIRKTLARRRDRFEFEPLLAARVDELGEELRDHAPHIVHFAGHGTTAGELLFNDGNGALSRVSADAFGSLLRALGGNTRLVVLNACFSREQARAVCDSTGLAIGMCRQISDRAAIAFSRALYGAIADSRSVLEAVRIAQAEIKVIGALGDAMVPELFVRSGVDASRLCLPRVAARTQRRSLLWKLVRHIVVPSALIALLIMAAGARWYRTAGGDDFAVKVKFVDEARQPVKLSGNARLETETYTPTVLVESSDMALFEQVPHRLNGSDAGFTVDSRAFRIASPARRYQLQASGIIYLELRAVVTVTSGTVSFAGERLPGGRISLAGRDCSGDIRNGYFEIPCADVKLPVKVQVHEPDSYGRRICTREFVLQEQTSNELVLGACPSSTPPPPPSCPRSPEELIRSEAAFAQHQDLGSLVALFAPGATIRDVLNDTRQPPRERYRAEFARHRFLTASHADIQCEATGPRILLCTSSSAGTFDDGHGYSNPPRSDHWVVERQGTCWRIRSLAINAAGKSFNQAEETAP
jgi:hypothetical protein